MTNTPEQYSDLRELFQNGTLKLKGGGLLCLAVLDGYLHSTPEGDFTEDAPRRLSDDRD